MRHRTNGARPAIQATAGRPTRDKPAKGTTRRLRAIAEAMEPIDPGSPISVPQRKATVVTADQNAPYEAAFPLNGEVLPPLKAADTACTCGAPAGDRHRRHERCTDADVEPQQMASCQPREPEHATVPATPPAALRAHAPARNAPARFDALSRRSPGRVKPAARALSIGALSLALLVSTAEWTLPLDALAALLPNLGPTAEVQTMPPPAAPSAQSVESRVASATTGPSSANRVLRLVQAAPVDAGAGQTRNTPAVPAQPAAGTTVPVPREVVRPVDLPPIDTSILPQPPRHAAGATASVSGLFELAVQSLSSLPDEQEPAATVSPIPKPVRAPSIQAATPPASQLKTASIALPEPAGRPTAFEPQRVVVPPAREAGQRDRMLTTIDGGLAASPAAAAKTPAMTAATQQHTAAARAHADRHLVTRPAVHGTPARGPHGLVPQPVSVVAPIPPRMLHVDAWGGRTGSLKDDAAKLTVNHPIGQVAGGHVTGATIVTAGAVTLTSHRGQVPATTPALLMQPLLSPEAAAIMRAGVPTWARAWLENRAEFGETLWTAQ